MKTKRSLVPFILFTVTFLLFSLLLIHCNSGRSDDSVNAANQQNKKTDTAISANSTAEGDAKFLVKAADGGMLEVQLGQIAAQRAVSQRVKNFGAMMVKDHTQANDELKALAASKNVALPQTLSDDSQSKLNKINELTGTDFDNAYADLMVDDHNDDVSDFKKEAAGSRDSTVQSFANNTLPVLQIHLDSAKAIQHAVKHEGKK